MSQETLTLTFPCPSCTKVLTVHRSPAIGPCPHCGAELQAVFQVTTGGPKEPEDQKKPFQTRAFRPDSRPAEPSKKSYTPGAH